ncbi:Na+/H+ antiporter subunit B [Catalinimonas niigatensis]|uniref:Na+/H+ antiporter subunit B n=1 Tax=Catalinimonas niigatensis TaxID=1397264 RepID=UPI0026668C30|nr:Na+/H+ antiporter subunit B [Catalinimonas niigatensis]WPP52155.1 Na+/H+ antiporter subunit B [Catalinimonas niigatensis]
MRSIILATAIRLLIPVFLLFSVYLFFRGHDEPGGGFIAALVTSIGFLFHMIALSKKETMKLYGVSTYALMGLGLGAVLLSAVLPLLLGYNLLEAQWLNFELPFIGKLGTPILFDLGVYLLVLGVILTIAFTLFEDE